MESAGKEIASTCYPASFLTKNTVHNPSGPVQGDSNDPNRGKVQAEEDERRLQYISLVGRAKDRGSEI